MNINLWFALFTFGLTSLYAGDQTLCPIMIEDEIDEEEVIEYKGKKIYMCCGSCAKAWEQNPDYYAAAAKSLKKNLLPQLKDIDLSHVKLMPQRFCVLRNDTIINPKSPSVTYKGKKIYFFKERDIERKWKKDPEGYFKKAREEGLLPQYD